MNKYKSLLESLESKELSVRRYSLSDMISESYKALYRCAQGSNAQKLVEAHLNDVKKNPVDTERLSRQLCGVKEIIRMIESQEMKDEDLVPEEKHDTVEPQEERALDLQESSQMYRWGDWQHERGNPHRVKFYSPNMDITNLTIGVVYEKSEDQPYYGAEIYDNAAASTIEERADDSYHFDTEEEAMEWVEEWFAKDNVDECDDPKKSTLEEAEEPDLTDEELEELAKHLETIRKDRKANANKPEDNKETMSEASSSDGRICQVGIDIHFPTDVDTRETESRISKILQEAGYDVVGCMFSDTSWSKEEYGLTESAPAQRGIKVHCSRQVKESRTYSDLQLGDFKENSSGKAFVKTFKKLEGKLKEGTALTRQEAISLYKAGNSAMTHLSVELEHNPEFLATFKECTSLLSQDISSVLGSLKEGKAPSKKTMKSLYKFTESLLCEAEEEEEELPTIEDEEEDFISDEEGEILSEEEESFDQEYADARVELHKELVDEHGESEDPGVQEKLAQDAEEVVSLPGISEEQIAEIQGEESTEEETPGEEPAPEAEPEIEEPAAEETPAEEPAEEEDAEDITDDELAELKRHLTEMRKAKRMQESADLLSQVKKSLDDAGISYTARGKNGDQLIVSKEDLKRASELRDKIDPEYTIKIASRA